MLPNDLPNFAIFCRARSRLHRSRCLQWGQASLSNIAASRWRSRSRTPRSQSKFEGMLPRAWKRIECTSSFGRGCSTASYLRAGGRSTRSRLRRSISERINFSASQTNDIFFRYRNADFQQEKSIQDRKVQFEAFVWRPQSVRNARTLPPAKKRAPDVALMRKRRSSSASTMGWMTSKRLRSEVNNSLL